MAFSFKVTKVLQLFALTKVILWKQIQTIYLLLNFLAFHPRGKNLSDE